MVNGHSYQQLVLSTLVFQTLAPEQTVLAYAHQVEPLSQPITVITVMTDITNSI